MQYDEQVILQYIKLHREISAEYHKLKAKQRRAGSEMSKCDADRFNIVAEKYEIVEEWLQMLPEDKAFVIRRHLIDEVDFKRIEAEHTSLWKEYGKSERTLRRYQKEALSKIKHFANSTSYNHAE